MNEQQQQTKDKTLGEKIKDFGNEHSFVIGWTLCVCLVSVVATCAASNGRREAYRDIAEANLRAAAGSL